MNDARRRAVRISIFLLPALLTLAGFHVARGDLRDSAAVWSNFGYVRDGHRFNIRGRDRAESLSSWVQQVIRTLENNRMYGFKAPSAGFQIAVRPRGGASEFIRGSNRILIQGIADDVPVDAIKKDLSRLIAKAMLWTGSPDADFSPWFEEGVSRFYEGPLAEGSRKDELLLNAARNRPKSLADLMTTQKGPYFDALSHAIVAFLHEAYSEDLRARYADVEREPGPVPPGTFERIFGENVEKSWNEFLDRRQKGS